MRRLKPLTILLLGVLLTGTAWGVVFVIVTPNARNWRGFYIPFSIGAAFGFQLFAPMAWAAKYHGGVRNWLKRHE